MSFDGAEANVTIRETAEFLRTEALFVHDRDDRIA